MDTRKITADYRMAKWMQILQDRKASGETVKAYCQMIGVSKDAYFYWQKKLREAACEQLALIPAKSVQTGLIKPDFAEVKLQDAFQEVISTESGLYGSLHIKVSDVRIDVDSNYPADKLTHLLRELVRQC